MSTSVSTFAEAEVLSIISSRSGLQKVSVVRSDSPGSQDNAYVLTDLTGPVASGDRVIINCAAVELDLGTGGWHFVHWNLSSADRPMQPGREMKLRYTSLQVPISAGETSFGEPPESLDSTPVIATMLLSQAAVAIAAAKNAQPDLSITLVMTDANGLAMAMSDLIAELVERQLLTTTITAGQAFGGDFEAVSILSALGMARQIGPADIIVVTPGPGSLGTGSRLGFSTIGTAGILDDISWYQGVPILGLRVSEADARARHQGLSHHCRTVLSRAQHCRIPVPSDGMEYLDKATVERHSVHEVEVPNMFDILREADLNVTTMGRGPKDDPAFFAFSGAAGIYATQLTQLAQA